MKAPVEKNQQIELNIIDIGSAGEGIGKKDGYTLFVPGALPGETVKALVVKAGRKFGFGKLLEVLQPAPERATPPCPYFPRCGGCTLQHLAYPAQLRTKKKTVQDCFERIGGQKDIPCRETTGMEEPWRYRNKSAFPVRMQKGERHFGLFAPRSHRVIDVEDCLIQMEPSLEALKRVRQWADAYGIPPYEENGKGLLRHLMVRCSSLGEIMVALVVNGKTIPREKALVESLESIPGIRSILLNCNQKESNVILGTEERTLWGKPYIEDEICGFRFRVSAQSFFQVNPKQTEVLYRQAMEYLDLRGGETVLDLYCGVGTITSLVATRAGRTVGVEYVEKAVEDARENAKRNGIDATFIAGDAKMVLHDLAKQETFDAVVLDPPRKGCDPEVLEELLLMFPEKIVYVSCNPATLARDAAILCAGGYTVKAVQPVDMFPHTSNVEAVALLSR